MTEKEKFVIKILKDSQNTYIENTKVEKVELSTDEVKVILNLIDKKQKELKKLDRENQGLFELYNFNDSSLLVKILKEYKETIDKQQKEIEKFKKPKFILNAETGTVTKLESNDDYISKDKIREFIKEELPDDEIMKCCNIYDINGIYIREKLEKLLQ